MSPRIELWSVTQSEAVAAEEMPLLAVALVSVVMLVLALAVVGAASGRLCSLFFLFN